MRLIYNKKDYNKLKNYLYENDIINKNRYNVKIKRYIYSPFFGCESSCLSFFWLYDNSVVFTFITEDRETKEKDTEYTLISNNVLEKMGILQD